MCTVYNLCILGLSRPLKSGTGTSLLDGPLVHRFMLIIFIKFLTIEILAIRLLEIKFCKLHVFEDNS